MEFINKIKEKVEDETMQQIVKKLMDLINECGSIEELREKVKSVVGNLKF